MLPIDVHWEYNETYRQLCLKVTGRAVAMVSPRATEGWVVNVNRHRGLDRRIPSGYAATLEHGQKMAQRWALANLLRLRREVSEVGREGLRPLR